MRLESQLKQGRHCATVSEHTDWADLMLGTLSNYPRLEFSMKEVRRAGKRLTSDLSWNDDSQEEIHQVFSIANSWRDSHVLPMRSIRYSVIHRMRQSGVVGFTVARAKRMISVRKKLRRHPGKLDQMQDLGGCRAIVEDIEGAKTLIEACRESIPHSLWKENDYITEAKSDGYRSHHIVFKFNGKEDREIFDGRRIELQIRTKLQHCWATAVEAVGLFRAEDLT